MLSEVVDAGVRWLIDSGIRINDKSSLLSGSFCGFYNKSTRDYPFVYCEITGYAIQFLLRISRWYDNKGFLAVAQASGEFLLRSQYKGSDKSLEGAFPYGYRLPGEQKIDKYYSFDTSICMGALVELYETFGDKRYLESALKAGRWLECMQNENGSFKSGHFGEEASPQDLNWYGDCGCLHAKNAIGLLKLYQATQDKRFLSLAKKTLDWALSLQHGDGYFRATWDYHFVFTHAHCYTIEGLLYGYFIIGEKRYLDAAVQGGCWLLRTQNSDGSLYQYYGPDVNVYLDSVGSRLKTLRKFIRPRDTGATAQAMRIWWLLYQETGDIAFHSGVERSARFVLSMKSWKRNDPNAFGGFHASCDKLRVVQRLSPEIYSWSTMFSCHGLALLNSKRKPRDLAQELF